MAGFRDLIGTSLDYFRIGLLSGIRLKNNAGSLEVRDSGDSAYTDALVDEIKLVDPANPTRSVSLGAPTLAASYSLKLPTDDGNGGNVLISDGVGNTSWGDSPQIIMTVVDMVTAGALSGNTYNNGTGGVGATLTKTTPGGIGTIDGITPVAGQRVLVKDEATSLKNGIYTVTALGGGGTSWVLTRATDADSSSDLLNRIVYSRGAGVLSPAGSAYVNSNASAITMGTTGITYVGIYSPAILTRDNNWAGENNFFSSPKMTLPTTVVTDDGALSYDTARKLLKIGDGNRSRGVDLNGWVPYAYPPGLNAANAFTTTGFNLAANGGTVVIPVFIPGHMTLSSIEFMNVDTTGIRTVGWGLYEEKENVNSFDNALVRVANSTADLTFTASVAAKRTVACADTYLAPGTYFLAIQNRHASNAFGLGFIAAGSLNGNFCHTKVTTNPNGSSLDFVAATWAGSTNVVGVRLNGKVFGDSVIF